MLLQAVTGPSLCDTQCLALCPVRAGICGFPLGAVLRSTNSAVWSSTLSSSASQLLLPQLTSLRRTSIDRLLPTLWRPRPWRWAAERPPRSRHNTYVRPWVLRHRGPDRPLTLTRMTVLPSIFPRISATRTMNLSVLNSPGATRTAADASPLTSRPTTHGSRRHALG